MCRSLVVSILVATLLLLTSLVPAALATSGDYEDVRCPVCGNEFEGWVWHSTNTHSRDSDFCKHALGSQVLMYAGWVCPKCLYSGSERDFHPKTAPTALIQQLRKKNPLKSPAPVNRKAKRTTDIPAWVRHDLRLQVLNLRKDATDVECYSVAMKAAWTHRFEIDVPKELNKAMRDVPLGRHSVDRGPHKRALGRQSIFWAWGKELNALDEKNEFTDTQRRLLLLHAALLLKREGEDPDARRVLSRLRARFPKLRKDEERLAADLEARIKREAVYTRRAVIFLERGIKEKPSKDRNLFVMRYLLAELYRKVGRTKEARILFDALAKEAKAPAWIRGVAQLARRKIAWTGKPDGTTLRDGR